jgi:putative acetyltransferase
MERALAALRKFGATGCVVLGDPKYYRRFGFKTELAIVQPDVPPEYFQIIYFWGALPPAARYHSHEAFSVRG